MADTASKRVLVLGGYGLIGAEIARHLGAHGHRVTALGRDQKTAERVLPHVEWVIRDLRDLNSALDWVPLLDGIDIVVNCAGALQDMPGDDLAAVHTRSITALAEACAVAGAGLVQVSAAGVSVTVSTAFYATKAEGDAAIRAAGCDWWILRPGLVLAPTGYGGTLLLRMLAAVPWVQAIALPDAPIQTISVSDVAIAVENAVIGTLPAKTSYDLVEDQAHPLRDIVTAFRHWLGFQPARFHLTLPGPLVWLVAKIADGLAHLGWRSPLRSTAISVLAGDVRGDSEQTRAALGRPATALADTLAAMPARSEDRIAARMALLMPVVVATLALFWAMSGVIGIMSVADAAKILVGAGWDLGLAIASVLFWAGVDMALAGAILIRRFAKPATLAMVGVSAVYLILASWVTPDMWADPLGPLVKVIPAMVLALVARALLESR